MTKEQLDTIRFYLDVATVAVMVFALVHQWRNRRRLSVTPVPVVVGTNVPGGWKLIDNPDFSTNDPTRYTS